MSRLLPYRSPPRLLTEAAYGCLKPPPTGRLRRANLHLSYSMTLSRLLDTTPAPDIPSVRPPYDVPPARLRARLRRAIVTARVRHVEIRPHKEHAVFTLSAFVTCAARLVDCAQKHWG